MQFIQIDNFNGNLSFVTKDDGSGEVIIFDNLQDALETLAENCQNGMIVPIDFDIVSLMIRYDEFLLNMQIKIQEERLRLELLKRG